MNKVRFGHNVYYYTSLLICCSIIILSGIAAGALGNSTASEFHLDNAIIVTQIPLASNQRAGTVLEQRNSGIDWFLEFGNGAHLIKVNHASR